MGDFSGEMATPGAAGRESTHFGQIRPQLYGDSEISNDEKAFQTSTVRRQFHQRGTEEVDKSGGIVRRRQ